MKVVLGAVLLTRTNRVSNRCPDDDRQRCSHGNNKSGESTGFGELSGPAHG